jgi:SAM-dependent methyltransferase
MRGPGVTVAHRMAGWYGRSVDWAETAWSVAWDAACRRTLLPLILERADVTDRRVIDVGCGDGWLSHALSRRARCVVGVDSDADAIGRAVARHRRDENVSFRVADVLSDEFAGVAASCDTIVSTLALHHCVKEPGWPNLARVLRRTPDVVIVDMCSVSPTAPRRVQAGIRCGWGAIGLLWRMRRSGRLHQLNDRRKGLPPSAEEWANDYAPQAELEVQCLAPTLCVMTKVGGPTRMRDKEGLTR